MNGMPPNNYYLLDTIDEQYLYKREKVLPPSPISLPLQQSQFRFCLVRQKGKKAYEKGWQDSANYRYDDPKLLEHVRAGGNYGVIGGFGGLVVIDIDREALIDSVMKVSPQTFTVRTKKGIHLYYVIDDESIRSQGLRHAKSGEAIGDLKAGSADLAKSRGYVVGPGSNHESGVRYNVIDMSPVRLITADEMTTHLQNVGISIGVEYRKKHKKSLRVKENDIGTKYHAARVDTKKDPEYLSYLPLWYRTYHRKRDGSILRNGDGRHIHLRICATLKKHDREHWKEHAHHLTSWMLKDDYDIDKTERELEGIDARYYFRKKDYFSFKGLDPDFQFLTEEELVRIRKVLAEHWNN